MPVNPQRRACAISVLGGPTTVIDIGGRRIVMDPTFDPAGPHAYLTKTVGPAVSAEALGPVDVVLISHDEHPDNLDDAGRRFALAAPLVLTHPGAPGGWGRRPSGWRPGSLSNCLADRILLWCRRFRPSMGRPTGAGTPAVTSTAR